MKSSTMFLVAVFVFSPSSSAQEAPGDITVAFWVGEALREDSRVRSAAIDVDCFNGVVTLSGTVRNLMERNYAGMIARRVQGVLRLVNDIRITPVPRSDGEMQDEITGRLNRMSFIPTGSISVSVTDAVAVLRGTVQSTSHSHEAEIGASEVRGIRQIRNEIEVRSESSRADADIAADVLATLRRDIYLNSLPIQATVQQGTATLKGTVSNAYQRRRAEILTWQVENVASVVNRIETAWMSDRSPLIAPKFPGDEELATLVTIALKQDPRVTAEGVRVQATDGQVTLRGYVPTQYNKDMAQYVARDIRGVVSVSNLLGVRAQIRSDREIMDDVLYLFQTDTTLQGRNLSVQSVEGFVTLRGQVTSFQVQVHAATVAGRVRGVRGVINNIEVQVPARHRDLSIAERIRTRLKANAETRWVESRIGVEVLGGIVTLSGDVGRLIERREAARMAYQTEGTTAVINKLTVNRIRYPWDQLNRDTAPTQDQYPIYRGDFFDRPGPVRM